MPEAHVTSLRDALVPSVIKDLTRRGQARHVPPGQTIFAQGDPGSFLFVIQTGQVEVSTVTAAGRKLVVSHLGAGDFLGEIAVLDQSPRSASAMTLSDVTGHVVGFDDFRAFLTEFPDVHFALTVELCAKLRSANDLLADQTQKGGDMRLARAVLRLAEKFGKDRADQVEIPIALSQADIGDLSGLTRANVNRYLRAWTDEGLIAFEKQRLTVVDIDGLRSLSEADRG